MPIYALDELTPTIHPDAYVHPGACVIGAVHIAEGASIWPGAVLRADYGSIYIGARTSIQDGTVMHTTPEWPTTVGDDCVVGHMAHLEGCTVHANSLVGSKSTVLNRVIVGERCLIAAGAVLLEGTKVPDGHIAAGVPARIREMTKDRTAWMDHAVGMSVDNAVRYRTGLRLCERDAQTA
jgi:carbonic anhydrase/acetyltransferase-like protein (isoleucine patch superfamily)